MIDHDRNFCFDVLENGSLENETVDFLQDDADKNGLNLLLNKINP